jgi:hypothetical protein
MLRVIQLRLLRLTSKSVFRAIGDTPKNAKNVKALLYKGRGWHLFLGGFLGDALNAGMHRHAAEEFA